MYFVDLSNYARRTPQPVHISFPPNIFVPSEDHCLVLTKLFQEHVPKAMEMQKDDCDHDDNIAKLKLLRGTLQEKDFSLELESSQLLQRIIEAHEAWKAVEATNPLDDIKVEVSKFEAEKKYLDLEDISKDGIAAAEQLYCYYHFPQPSDPLLKVVRQDRNFLLLWKTI